MCKSESIKTGWAQADITPDKNVLLAGQFHARVSEGIMDPVTATAFAVESVNSEGVPGQVVMVSCDLVSISDDLRDAVRERIKSGIQELDPENIFIGATHTHSAPDARLATDGMWSFLDLDVMPPADYLAFAADRIAGAVREAWEKREASGIAYGLGHAVVGRNRRLTYTDGMSRMYGNPGATDFGHVEGYEDHSVYAMMTYNRNKKLTGLIVNVPCP